MSDASLRSVTTTRTLIPVLLFVLLPAVCRAVPLPKTLVLEAEDFVPSRGSFWKPIVFGENYFHCCIGTAYFSGEKLLSAPERCPASTASLTVQIPAKGAYMVWVHFESPKDYNVRFGLSIIQNGCEVLDAQMGGADQVKLWPLKWGYQAQVDPYYGGGDNVAWQGARVDLEKGEATFILRTLDNPEPAAKRNIDVIFLTPDLSEEPTNPVDPFLDDLPRPGRLYMRITNTGSEPLKPSIGAHINRRNWRVPEHWWTQTEADRLNDPIQPGSSSGWLDISGAIDTVHGTTLELYSGTGDKAFECTVEFAPTPSSSERWRYEWKEDENPLFIWVPVDLDVEKIVTSSQVLNNIRSYISSLPKKLPPNKIRFCAAPGGPDKRLGRHGNWIDLFYELGYTTPMTNPGKDEDEWIQLCDGDPNRKVVGVTHTDPKIDPEKLKNEWLDPKREGARKRLAVFSIGDEINLASYDSNDGITFEDALRQAGFTLDQLGITDWAEAIKHCDDPLKYPVLYVENIKYRNQRSIIAMARLRQAINEAFGPNVWVSANFAPHPGFLPDEWQWVDVFKYRALTMPWSEDYHWQVPVISSQIIGYTLDIMRCAAKYHDLPMQFYCMPHSPGNTNKDFRLSNYLALGRGVKFINHYCPVPQLFATENYVDWRDKSRYKEIYSVIRESAEVDNLLYAGKPPKAEVAIMLCRYTDLWEKFGPPDAANKRTRNDRYNAYGVERQGIWLALKHAQVPIDLITDPDVCEGSLSNYKVLYLAGTHISADAAKRIREWIESGGILFSSAAGGLYDEYNRPLKTLLPVYRIESHNYVQKDWEIRPKQELPRLEPLDCVKLAISGTKGKMEALAVVDKTTVDSRVSVLGTFSNGTPAVIRSSYGKGAAYLVSTMPGLAYQKSALPVKPFDRGEFAHFLPTGFSSTVRELICLPLSEANIIKRVECSEPLVEGDMLQSELGTVISLANFSGKRVNNLEVVVRTDSTISNVWAVNAGKVSFKRIAGGVRVQMPLDVTDFLVIQP